MEATSQSSNSARRNEDIALDLMKFIAAVTGAGKTPGTATGFGSASATKTEDSVAPLLELYTRCLHTVEGK